MGGVKDFMFGKEPKVKNTSTLTPGQTSVLNNLNSMLENSLFTTNTPEMPAEIANMDGWMGKIMRKKWAEDHPSTTSLNAAPVYEGDMTAGPSSIQSSIFKQIPGLLGGIGGDKTVNSALDSFLNKYRGGYSAKAFDPTSTLNMFQKSVYDPAMKSYKEETLPQIAELFAGRGSFDSGGTLHTMTESAEDLMGSLMGTKASMLDSAKNAWDNMEMNKFLGINSLIPSVAGAKTSSVTSGLAGLPYAMAAGDTQQGLDQAEINELITKWTQEQPYNNPYLNLLSLALGTPAITPVVQGGSTGLLSALAPGAGAALGAYLAS